MMKSLIAASALTLSLASTALASSDDKVSPDMDQKIRAQLTEQGYEVAKIESDDGLYEAYARKDGQRYEIYLNAALEIVKVEKDD